MTETHLSDEIGDPEINIDGFHPHRCERARNSHGRTIIYTDEYLKAMKILEFRNEQCEVVGVLIRDMKTIIEKIDYLE